ncbi:MAG: ATP-grasp domain-containing protein [Patescibacteria group bacterium]|jgi:D-alanine-D-alanine ligase
MRTSKQSDLRGRTLLLVNTGSLKKKFIVQRLKKLGLTIVALNKEKNWAQPYVDHWILADTANHSEAIKAVEVFRANTTNPKLEGVVTFWEDDVLLTSKIVDKFGFPGIPYSVSRQIRNKHLFREFCEKNSISVPRHKLIKQEDDLEYVKKNFTFPLVVKPTYGSSSAFVVKAENKQELQETYEYVKTNLSTTIESALSDGFSVIIEEYVDGDEVDLDILVQNGKVKFYSIADNYQTREPFFLETGYALPSDLPEDDQKALIDMAEETLEKLGVMHGCIHFEAKSTSHGPVPIEVNLRMGGDEIYPSVKAVWGVDLIEYAARIALGEFIKIQKPEEPKTYIRGMSLQADNSGILVQLDVDENLKKKCKFIEEVNIAKKVGDPVLVPPEGYEFLGWVTASGENPIDAEDNLNELLKEVRFNVVRFDPASSIGKTQRRNRFSTASLNKQLLVGAAKIENIKRMSLKDLRKLHIGIACNIFDGKDGSVEQELMSVGKNIEKTLAVRGYRVSYYDFNNLPKAFNDLRKSDVDLVFNVCERINNSSLLEPHAASILDTLQIPYTGSNPFTLGLCIDKIRVKKLLTYHNIPTAKWDYAYTMDDEIRDDLQYPLIVKPANTDNSIGITNESVVTNKRELKKQMEKVIKHYKRPALIEEYIEGDEYDVSIIGDDENDLRVLPLSRSVFDRMPEGKWHIYTFDTKFGGTTPKEQGIEVQRPAKGISKKLEALISEIALDTYNILDCHDYGRVEIKVDKNNNPYVLELNPNPSINIPDCLPSVAKLVGMEYGDFLEEIIKMAINRYKNRPPYYHLQGNLL